MEPRAIKRRSVLKAAAAGLLFGFVGVDSDESKASWHDPKYLIEFWSKFNADPPLKLVSDFDGTVKLRIANDLTPVAAHHGFTLARPESLLGPIAKTPEVKQQLRLIQNFFKSELSIIADLSKLDNPTRKDVAGLYSILLGLSALPRELYQVVRQGLGTEMEFVPSQSNPSRCAIDELGCAARRTVYLDLQNKYSAVSSYVVANGLHEIGHIVEGALLQGVADQLHKLDPYGFELVPLAIWKRNPYYNPFPKAVAQSYGQVDTESISTLFPHLAFGDFNSFMAFDDSELNPADPSARVQKLAALISVIDLVLSHNLPHKCDFVGFVRDTFTGAQRQQFGLSTDNLPLAAELSYQATDPLTRDQPTRSFLLPLKDGVTQIKCSLSDPGLLSADPPHQSIEFFGPSETMPAVQILEGRPALSTANTNELVLSTALSMKYGRSPSSLGGLRRRGGCHIECRTRCRWKNHFI